VYRIKKLKKRIRPNKGLQSHDDDDDDDDDDNKSNIIAPESISVAYFINPSHQSVHVCVSPYRC
jgi:hypothetical protein